jgi:AAA domain, putative AbiEii toxin, Type IV TA system
MYDSIKLENFRSFEELSISGLKRVNLFVGKNNAGKTSILEAIELLSSNGYPTALLKIPRRREERVYLATEERLRTDVDIRHLFIGHQLEENSWLRISGQSRSKEHILECRIVDNTTSQQDISQQGMFNSGDDPLNFEKLLALQLTGSELAEKIHIPISSEGVLFMDDRVRVIRPLVSNPTHPTPITFLGTEGIDSSQLKKFWDLIVLTPKEGKVYEALRSIAPDIEGIAFTGTGTVRYSSGGSAFGIVVKSKNADRIPLGSMGDGIRRLLGLAICLVNSENSCLLIDEIDTGLHYSTMADMWSFIIQTANLLNVQVFATTHSWDCVRALAWLQQESPDLADSVTLHRVDMGEPKTMCYSTEELEIAARHHIEVRG